MSINVGVNHPLIRELREIGILSADAAPKIVGPFKIQTECFVGDSSGATKALAQTPISGGVFNFMTIATAQGTANTLTQRVEDTDYSRASGTITYLTDLSGHQVMIQYAY